MHQATSAARPGAQAPLHPVGALCLVAAVLSGVLSAAFVVGWVVDWSHRRPAGDGFGIFAGALATSLVLLTLSRLIQRDAAAVARLARWPILIVALAATAMTGYLTAAFTVGIWPTWRAGEAWGVMVLAAGLYGLKATALALCCLALLGRGFPRRVIRVLLACGAWFALQVAAVAVVFTVELAHYLVFGG